MTISRYEFGDTPCKNTRCRYEAIQHLLLRDRDKIAELEKEIEKLQEIIKEQRDEVYEKRAQSYKQSVRIVELRSSISEQDKENAVLKRRLVEAGEASWGCTIRRPTITAPKPYGWRSFKEDGPPPIDKYSEVFVEQEDGKLSLQANVSRDIMGWCKSVTSWIPLPYRGCITPKSPISGRRAWLDRGGQLETDKGE